MSPFGLILAIIGLFITVFSAIYFIAMGDIFVYFKSSVFFFTILGYILLIVAYTVGRAYGESVD